MPGENISLAARARVQGPNKTGPTLQRRQRSPRRGRIPTQAQLPWRLEDAEPMLTADADEDFGSNISFPLG